MRKLPPGAVVLGEGRGKGQQGLAVLADAIKLIQANPGRLSAIRDHLTDVHAGYAAQFDHLVQWAWGEAGDML